MLNYSPMFHLTNLIRLIHFMVIMKGGKNLLSQNIVEYFMFKLFVKLAIFVDAMIIEST